MSTHPLGTGVLLDLDGTLVDSLYVHVVAWHEDMLLAARDELFGAPRHVVMVGDAPWDMRAAQRANMEAVAVRCGGFSDDTLAAAGASRIVDNPLDLVGTL